MSFKQRLITPIFVSRVQVENNAGDELEWVVNHTMSNIILQLSSLSRHAEDLFADLCRSTVDLNQRATNLGTKIKEIGERVSQLDATEEEVLFHNIHKCRHYKSTDQHDQQVVARITMSQAIQDLYNMCARPPPLDRLNTYRNDGKDCMKFYTDPAYFFELWLLAIQQDIEQKKEQKKKKGKARKHKRNVQVKVKDVTSIRERNKHKGMGAEFADDIRHKSIKTETHSTNQQQPMVNGDLPPPDDLDLLRSMSDEGAYPPPPPLMNQCYPDQDDLPPPPPPPLDESQSVTPPPPPPLLTSSGPQPPVAPPPPPPLNENGTPPPPPPPVGEMVKEPQKNQAVNKPDRSDLLSQIRAGNTQLKKMEDRKQQDKPKPPQDVHSMMTQLFVARRQAMEDTDSEGDDDDDDDDDEWDED